MTGGSCLRSPIITQRLASGKSASASLALTLLASSSINQSNTLNRNLESIASRLQVPATRLYGSRSSPSTSGGQRRRGTFPAPPIPPPPPSQKTHTHSSPAPRPLL